MRGDIYRLRSDRRARGHEQTGTRYAVVLSNLPLSTVVVAPTSTSAQERPFRPRIEMPDGNRTILLVDQIAAVDLERLGEMAGRVAPQEIEQALRLVLELL